VNHRIQAVWGRSWGILSRRLEGINPGADGPLRTLEALQGRGDAVGDMRV